MNYINIAFWTTIFVPYALLIWISFQPHVAASEIIDPRFVTEYKQDRILHDLMMCESSGVARAVNPRDVDGKVKYGHYQYDTDTMKDVWYAFNMERISTETAKTIAYDPELSKEVTRFAIFEAGMSWRWGCWGKIIKNYEL